MDRIIPGVINDAIITLNGGDEIVGAYKLTPPDMNLKTEEMSGLGLSNYEEVIDSLYESMTTVISFTGLTKNVGIGSGKTFNLVAIAAIQGTDPDTGETSYRKVVHTVRGKVKTRKNGEITRGGKSEPELEIATTYYKHEIDGVVMDELNVFSRVAIINGEDIRAGINQILGV